MIIRNWLLLTTVILFYLNGESQPTITNSTSVKPDSNIIYKEVENFIKVNGVTNSHSVRLKSSKLLIAATRDSRVFSVNAQSFETDTIYLILNGKIVFSKAFKIVSVPQVIAMLGNITDSIATLKQVIINPNLRAIRQNCNCYVGHIIGTFRITFISRYLGNVENSYDVNGGKFDFLDNIIKRLRSNDKIVFDNIRTVDIDSKSIKLDDFTITIK